MSKPAKVGGVIQIRGARYEVLMPPSRLGEHYRILAKSMATEQTIVAQSDGWRGGRGPWTVVSDDLGDLS